MIRKLREARRPGSDKIMKRRSSREGKEQIFKALLDLETFPQRLSSSYYVQ